MRKFHLISAIIILAGCSSTPTERYDLADDVAPELPPSVVHLENAQPKYEPYSLAGNKDYHLRGGSYKIVQDTKGFTETGGASWYGQKFHGHYTSNGEVYDMYSMTAAHKTLPLPSYVKVTNLENNKTVIVRVNDRGPFHEGRIIDLSYAAAKRIGSLEKGTVPVHIEVIEVAKPDKDEVHVISEYRYFVQLAAVSQPEDAIKRATPLAEQHDTEVSSQEDTERGLFRVRLGPFLDRDAATQAQHAAQQAGFENAYIITSKRSQSNDDGVVISDAKTTRYDADIAEMAGKDDDQTAPSVVLSNHTEETNTFETMAIETEILATETLESNALEASVLEASTIEAKAVNYSH